MHRGLESVLKNITQIFNNIFQVRSFKETNCLDNNIFDNVYVKKT